MYNPAETFLQEADELLGEIEQTTLGLGGGTPVEESVNQLFRAFHTIKGSGAMFGFTEVAGFTHHMETLLDAVRAGSVPVSPELIELVLAARDRIKLLLSGELSGETASGDASQSLVARMERLFQGSQAPCSPIAQITPVAPPAGEREWRIRFVPNPGLLTYGANPLVLFRELAELGECRISAHTENLPPLDQMQPDICYVWWTFELRTSAPRNAIRDVFIFVEDGSDLTIEPIETEASQPAGVAPVVVAETTPAVSSGRVPARESSVRVPAGRLDRLVGLVGELVMNQSRLAAAASRIGSAELAAPVEEIERLVAELRDNVLGIRMMPIGTIFGRFRRLVHDLSAELAKEVDLVTEGEGTELDKSVIDQLGEPLVHLLRNSIDHGIEPAEQRVAGGKSPRGTIRLAAVHAGSSVVVSVTDDGKGLDPAALRAKAVEKRLIAADAVLSDKETFNLILLPGFSTAREVTKVSGRGVGMDVVKRQIDALHGSLAISSEPGKGTKISLTLPLTLAIIEGLVVEVGNRQFILPMVSVAENVELHRTQRARNNGRNVVAVRGELVPYIDLRGAFHLGGEPPEVEKVVIAEQEGQRVGLVVERVLGTHQTVIQPLGRFLRNIEVVSGATVMGDGRVAVILDIPGVVRLAEASAH